jgi:hypothetical protein
MNKGLDPPAEEQRTRKTILLVEEETRRGMHP